MKKTVEGTAVSEIQIGDIVRIEAVVRGFFSATTPVLDLATVKGEYFFCVPPKSVELVSRPKTKTKKTLEVWVNFYPDGSMSSHSSQENADYCIQDGTFRRIACEHFTREIEVEE